MIIHTVVFRLKHAEGSAEEKAFMDRAKVLTAIPGVTNFQYRKQVSPKNNFTFGFSMEFESDADYQGYNEHPNHVDFVQNVWLPEVEEFMELDFERFIPAA
jgi:hypothetical protein